MSMKKGASKGKGSEWGMDHVAKGVADISLGGSDGAWEQVARKNKNKAGGSTAKQWPTDGSSKAPDMANRVGMGANDGSAKVPRNTGKAAKSPAATTAYENRTLTAALPPRLENGWNWAARAGSIKSKTVNEEQKELVPNVKDDVDEDEDEDDAYFDDDDGLLSDDSDEGYDKNHKLLRTFFEALDSLTVDEINETSRQWHCPACQGGPGAIDWYRGLKPLITHAKTKGTTRVKLHREFAELLEKELYKRGSSLIPSGETFGLWEGLKQETRDFEIVWPPMVIVMNTRLDKDETNERWIGMGNQELLDYFSSYRAEKARHSYGPQGHRGMSVLIFESSAVGYLEAERLHKHFLGQGTGRDAWNNPRRQLFFTAGKRQLYGFLALKEDIEIFNQHCQGKTRVKFDMRSYNEMVVSQMKQMSEENQQLNWYKNKVNRVQRETKAVEESLHLLSQKYRMVAEENRIVRQRTKLLYEQNKEAMEYQEQFYKDQITQIHEATDAKENDFERLQQEERKKIELSSVNASTTQDHRGRAVELAKFIEIQEKEMQAFVEERDKLIQVHKDKMNEMKKRHWEEEVELEKGFDAALTKLMENYKPGGQRDI
ncbi:Protein SUPPRESSOR OF GENE SILENCING [Dionaea muscipula]